MNEKDKNNLDKKLNIIYIGTLPPHRGGSAVSGSQLVIELAKLGHNIRCIASITPEELESGDKFKDNNPQLNISRFLVPYFETSPDFQPTDDYRNLEKSAIQCKLIELIKEKKPDILFAGRETFAWHIPYIANKYDIPAILRTAGATTNGILNNTIAEEPAAKLISQYKKFDLLISPAKHLEDSIKGLGVSNIITIINAVDNEHFAPREKNKELLYDLGISDSSFVVGHISNMKSIKRPFDIVDSAQDILKDHPDIVFLVIGDGHCLADMKRRCADKNVTGNFRFTGWLDYESIPDYMNLCDVVVLQSESEGLARVSLETQSAGKCLIASDIAPTHEIIRHGQTGLIFKLGDTEDLTSKILLAYNDRELITQIGSNARNRIYRHSIHDAAIKYVDTFSDVIESFKGSRIVKDRVRN